jgi:hypothetical protein
MLVYEARQGGLVTRGAKRKGGLGGARGEDAQKKG